MTCLNCLFPCQLHVTVSDAAHAAVSVSAADGFFTMILITPVSKQFDSEVQSWLQFGGNPEPQSRNHSSDEEVWLVCVCLSGTN